MMAALAVGTFLGYLAGKWLDTDYMILIGLALGVIAGYQNVYHLVKRYMKNPQLSETVEEPSEDELRRKKAEEEFDRWRQERNSDER